MSKQATEFQKKAMSKIYRGKAIFKPLNTCCEYFLLQKEWYNRYD